MELTTHNTMKNGYDTLLLGYAAGILDHAQKLAVDAHLSFSTSAQEFVNTCEAIGGTLIQEHCENEPMHANSLDNVLNRLDDLPALNRALQSKPLPNTTMEFDLPSPISNALKQEAKDFKWRNVYPGFKSYDLDIDCETSIARFVQAKPGMKSPNHSHAGTEITVILDGAFSDETGEYKVGDLIVTDESCEHAPIACKFQGCTCFVVTTAPIKLTGIASLLNPFLKP